ncbi:MAG: hypothetical protein ABI528_07970, partial [bacterium]
MLKFIKTLTRSSGTDAERTIKNRSLKDILTRKKYSGGASGFLNNPTQEYNRPTQEYNRPT